MDAKPTSSANFLQSSNFANMFGGSGGSGGGGMAGIGQAGDAINSMISNVTGPATASTVSESICCVYIRESEIVLIVAINNIITYHILSFHSTRKRHVIYTSFFPTNSKT